MTIQCSSRFVVVLGLVFFCLNTASVHAEPANGPQLTPAVPSSPVRPEAAPVPPELSQNSNALSVLTGLPRQACEAMLCLGAIGDAPAECAESLAAYHAVQMFGGGPAFLAACPLVE